MDYWKWIVVFLLVAHGFIHGMGFAKAFGLGAGTDLGATINKTIQITLSKPVGLLWLLVSLLFLATAFLLGMGQAGWLPVLLVAPLFSEALIIATAWQSAKYGTVLNVGFLMVFGVGYALQHFEGFYEKDVQAHMRAPLPLKLEPVGKNSTQDIVQETDLRPLPAVVQNYLRYCGAVGKPKVRTMRLVFRGQMRGEKDGKPDDWFAFRSVQYNFFEDPARLFFMKAHMWGMPVWGYHDYQHGAARMRIKPLGLFMAAHMEGPVADKTETVTYFNDLCLFAPAALIDNRIRWQPMDGLRAGATYTNGTISIQAVLYFNTSGQLVNFTSDDRSEISIGKPRPFSTPVRAYKDFDGRRIPTYGEAIWHDGPKAFVYGKFWLESIEYNVETSGEGNEIQTR